LAQSVIRRYRALALLLLPLVLARLWWQGWRQPGYPRRWRERLGLFEDSIPGGGAAPLWIHAVSVGEVAAAVPLVRALREAYPTIPVLLTTTTPTGREAAERQLGQSVRHAVFPYDASFALRRFFARYRPRALLVMETELWPNLISQCERRGVPVALLNARLSARSARGYARFPRLTAETLRRLDLILAQSADDSARFIALGATPDSVQVAGSLKFDVSMPASLHEEAAVLRRALGTDRPIVMAGSVREGEDERIIAIYLELRRELPTLAFLIAPRHPARFDGVTAQCVATGLRVGRRSAGDPREGQDLDILVLDTMGELPRFYAAADVAIVGGSLAPLGGQNMLEPAALGIPVVVGPHLYNFAEVARRLEAGGALRIGRDDRGITAQVRDWLVDGEARDRAGAAARSIVDINRGATRRTLEQLVPLLGTPDASPRGSG
jgi:3-deoxy-D-manno-octulosonic-acid transferase